MKRLLALTPVLMFVVCSGCGDSHESLTDESQSTMKEFVSALDGVKDEASAKSAKPKLKSLVEKLNSIKERQAKLPAPTEAQFKAMETKYGKEMEEFSQKLAGHMLRIAFNPKIRAELDDIGQGMKKSMN